MNRFVVTAGLLLVLAGCGYRGIPVEDSEQLWQARQLELAAVEEWNMRARAVLRFDEEAYQVGFSWRREADRFALLFEAPFGQGVIRIGGRQAVESGKAQVAREAAQVHVGDEPRTAQGAPPRQAELADVETLEHREDRDALATAKARAESGRLAVDEQKVHLGRRHAEALQQRTDA